MAAFDPDEPPRPAWARHEPITIQTGQVPVATVAGDFGVRPPPVPTLGDSEAIALMAATVDAAGHVRQTTG